MARESASAWGASDAEIERMCRDISNDGSIAICLGVERERVAKVRATMKVPTRNPKRFLDHRAEPEDQSDGSGANLVARKRAEADSRFLREAIERLYRRFAHNHRLTVEEAKVVNLYGWGTLKRLREKEQAPFIGKAAA